MAFIPQTREEMLNEAKATVDEICLIGNARTKADQRRLHDASRIIRDSSRWSPEEQEEFTTLTRFEFGGITDADPEGVPLEVFYSHLIENLKLDEIFAPMEMVTQSSRRGEDEKTIVFAWNGRMTEMSLAILQHVFGEEQYPDQMFDHDDENLIKLVERIGDRNCDISTVPLSWGDYWKIENHCCYGERPVRDWERQCEDLLAENAMLKERLQE